MTPPLPTGAQPPGAGRMQWAALKAFMPNLWPKNRMDLKVRVVLALACLVAAKATNVSVPLFLRDAFDALAPTDANAAIVLPVAILIGYGLARVSALAFGEFRDFIFAKVAQHAVRHIALITFRHLHALSLRFHMDRQTGGLNRAIERGAKGIEFLLSYVLFSVLPTLLEITMVCGILWWQLGAEYALITFVTIAFYITFTFSVTEWRTRFRRVMNEMDGNASTKAVDSLLNYETVKYLGNEEHEVRRYDSAMAAYEAAAVKSKTSLSVLNIGQSIIVSIGVTGLMILAAYGVANGTMTIGEFGMVNAYLLQLAVPLNWLGMVYREIRQSLTDMVMLFLLFKIEREGEVVPISPALRTHGGTLVFENVNFGYDPRRPILHDVSFEVPAGKTLAIVGSSGAGKSTISRLLFRFYDVSSGSIQIDDQEIRSVTQQSLRAAIGIVPQDTVLFNDTVYYNIAYGRPDASPSEVEAAARMAQIHDFVTALPDGYQTTVGERGLKLSGGEKQRVAIARTILKGPALLLFDEATSALDTATEQEIQKIKVAKDLAS